ncbi:hypothetical protein [Zoogloea sp. 1C4]|nr:hypothetical protein [Zoogloea sp. 1C4]
MPKLAARQKTSLSNALANPAGGDKSPSSNTDKPLTSQSETH